MRINRWKAVSNINVVGPHTLVYNYAMSIKKELFKRCKGLSSYLKGVAFSEKDVELDLIGLD